MPASPADLFRFLDELGLATRTYDHPPLRTVAETKTLRGELPGGHCKSLFLKDRRGRLVLLVTLEDRAIDLGGLSRRIGARNLSFAGAELLHEVLGVAPGAVSPFALINDRPERVSVILDRHMLDRDPLNYHPLTNERTTAIAPAALLKFIRACGHEPVILDLDGSGT